MLWVGREGSSELGTPAELERKSWLYTRVKRRRSVRAEEEWWGGRESDVELGSRFLAVDGQSEEQETQARLKADYSEDECFVDPVRIAMRALVCSSELRTKERETTFSALVRHATPRPITLALDDGPPQYRYKAA